MTDIALRMDGVYKKFRKGELYDSLRDLIPALAGRVLRRRRREALAPREFWALQDVTVGVRRGEAFGIIGANGAGKSTILKLLSGIMRPTRGTLQVNGRLSALIEVSAGFHPDLTGRENIFLNGTILGMTRAEIRQRFDAIVAFSGLEEFIDTPVKRYSSGMFARLGFSVAAHVEPDLLVVDEVLSVGDYLFQQKCLERMQEIMTGGATVIFVSHNLRAVSTLCTRSLLLERGRVVELGPSNEVIRAYLTRGREARALEPDRQIRITDVSLGPPGSSRVQFETGEFLEITVTAAARTPHSDMSVVIAIANQIGGPRRHIFRRARRGRDITLHVQSATAPGPGHVPRQRLPASLCDGPAIRALAARRDVFRGEHSDPAWRRSPCAVAGSLREALAGQPAHGLRRGPIGRRGRPRGRRRRRAGSTRYERHWRKACGRRLSGWFVQPP